MAPQRNPEKQARDHHSLSGRSTASSPAEMQRRLCNHDQAHKEHSMMDFLMLALAFGFFALAIGYTYACERL
jgi:hypothetical protein